VKHGPGHRPAAFSRALGAEVDAGGPRPVVVKKLPAQTRPLWRQQQGEDRLCRRAFSPAVIPAASKPHGAVIPPAMGCRWRWLLRTGAVFGGVTLGPAGAGSILAAGA